MPFFNLSRSSTRTVDSSKSDSAVDAHPSLHYIQSNAPSLTLKPTISGMKAELLDEDDQAWGSSPSHKHKHVPTFRSSKKSRSS